MIGALLLDLRHSARSLRNNPGFASIAILTLALGIGANTALFSVVDGVLLRPLPYIDSERIVQIFRTEPRQGLFGVAPGDVLDWKAHVTALVDVTALQTLSMTLNSDGDPERIVGAKVSASLFALLGVMPAQGQPFGSAESRPGGQEKVLLYDGLWQRRFGAQRSLLGKTILLDGAPHTVIGIMPATFRFAGADVLLPLVLRPEDRFSRSAASLRAYGRIAPGLSLSKAQAQMNVVMQRSSREFHQDPPLEAKLIRWRDSSLGDFRPAFLALSAAAILVLLIACANVAHLLLARGAARRKEFAVRMALGASASRLLRQLLTESMLLSIAGGTLGLLLAAWAVAALKASGPNLPRMSEVGIQSPVLLFTFLVTAMTALLFGLFPALEATRRGPLVGLRDGGRATAGPDRQRARRLLVGIETAFAIVLLVGAGLFLKSLARLSGVPLGFEPKNVLTFRVALPRTRYPDGERQAEFFRRLLESAATLPGVDAAGASSTIPLSQGMSSTGLFVEGRPGAIGGEGTTQFASVSPDYFKALGIPVLKGRAFNERDGPEAPGVAMVNDSLARRFFPDRSPIGQRINLDDPPEWREIIGVVGDVRHQGLDHEPVPTTFFPYRQNAAPLLGRTASLMTVVLKGKVDPGSLAAAARRAVQEIDPSQPVHGVMTLQQLHDLSLAQPKFRTFLLAGFAALAVLLSAFGIYGVVAHGVAERTHEIGVRLALGAQPRRVLRLIVRQGMTPVFIGTAAGVLGAAIMMRSVSSLLFEVTPLDPAVFPTVSILLVAVAFLACWFPARAATRVDPIAALRAE